MLAGAVVRKRKRRAQEQAELLGSSVARGGQLSKYCRCHSAPSKHPLPLAIGAIWGSNSNTQVSGGHFHGTLQ